MSYAIGLWAVCAAVTAVGYVAVLWGTRPGRCTRG